MGPLRGVALVEFDQASLDGVEFGGDVAKGVAEAGNRCTDLGPGEGKISRVAKVRRERRCVRWRGVVRGLIGNGRASMKGISFLVSAF